MLNIKKNYLGGVNMHKGAIIAIVLVALVAIFGVSTYNGLVGMNETVNGKWSQVDNQLQRRADLIPNLVNTVKGYAAHEQAAIQAVSDARSKLVGAQGVGDKAAAAGEMNSALSRLLAIAENYPNLKADKNFRALQDELAGTENRIAVARKDYNDAVQGYNTKIKTFPQSMFAGMLGFGQREYFKAEEGAKLVPQVKF